MTDYQNFNYRLEFSEEQQHFFLSNRTHVAETNGYTTILENCTNSDFKKFKKFLELGGSRRFYTAEFVKEIASEFTVNNHIKK